MFCYLPAEKCSVVIDHQGNHYIGITYVVIEFIFQKCGVVLVKLIDNLFVLTRVRGCYGL